MSGFAKGADVSWLTEMEKDGVKFYNQNGKATECMKLLREEGTNSIRLRVWVNPEGGWCGKDDVIAKAWRAQQLGFRLMIDFHYSDTWADPGNQKVPAAWQGYTAEQMKQAVADHTKDVLTLPSQFRPYSPGSPASCGLASLSQPSRMLFPGCS